MRRALMTACVVLATTTIVAGAEFWEKVPYLQWSDGQVRKVMTKLAMGRDDRRVAAAAGERRCSGTTRDARVLAKRSAGS